MIEYSKRKNIRLKKYDYSLPGMYFVTICTARRQCIFGDITEGRMVLNEWGQIVLEELDHLPSHYSSVSIDVNVVMPNHVHVVIWIHDDNAMQTRPILGNIICGFKAGVTRRCHEHVWQRGYYEHIIRNEKELQEIRAYIANNPKKWDMDMHNSSNPKYESWIDSIQRN